MQSVWIDGWQSPTDIVSNVRQASPSSQELSLLGFGRKCKSNFSRSPTMDVLDVEHVDNMGSEMVCIDEGMMTYRGKGFDMLNIVKDMGTHGSKSFGGPSLSMGFDMWSIEEDMRTHDGKAALSIGLDMLSIEEDMGIHSGKEFGCMASSYPKNTVLVEDPVSIEEPYKGIVMPELSVDAGTWQQPRDSAVTWQQRYDDPVCEMLSIEDALAFLAHTADVPSVENFICILQKCRKTSNLVHAQRAHLNLCDKGLEDHIGLGNYLIPMFVDCGGMADAERIFNRLGYRNEHSWTSFIQGYVACGEVQWAVDLYQTMLHDFVDPSNYTFVALIKACTQLSHVERGQFFHAEIVKKGTERDSFIGSALVGMYAKCGSLAEARQTFDETAVQDVVSWTALISGYVEHGLGEEALICVEEMQWNGLSPDAVTIVSSLKACGNIGAIEKGRKIHTEIVKMGFTGDLFVGNILVDTYAKCGSLIEAKKVFEELPVRDEVSWTAMIAAYVEHELGQEALNCLEPMQLEGVTPVTATFVCILKACVSIGAIDSGRKLHDEIVKKGFEGDPFVGNTVVDMYAKCGSLSEAREVLSKLPVQDAVPWTALIAGYAEHGHGEEVLKCFEQVRRGGVSPDVVTFVCSLKACGSLVALDKGREIHVDIVKIGFEGDVFAGNTLVGMYAKCGALIEAREMFDKLLVRDVVSWNAIIAGYAEYGPGEEALTCFHQMQSEGVLLDAVTWACILKACGSIGAIDTGQELHGEVAKKGFETDLLVGNTLVDMYGKCGLLVEAGEVFNMLTVQDEVSWNALILGYTEHGLDEQALNSFQQMQLDGVSPDIVSWNTMILGYAEQGENEKASMLYASMQEQGLLPNSVIFVSILKACGDPAAIESVKRIHTQICKVDGLEATGVIMATTLIDIYGKCGSMVDAQQVFDASSARALATWNALITGYARQGQSETVFRLFLKMEEDGIQPDEVTFLSILNVCSHVGLLDKGMEYFEIMCQFCGITPHLEHHTCMVDLYGRAGQLDEAVAMVEKLPAQPDLVVWHTVLGACRKWGNTMFGSKAFQHAVVLDKRHAAPYISMANIYADAGMWEDVKRIEAMRTN